jgi:hypothetical protein
LDIKVDAGCDKAAMLSAATDKTPKHQKKGISPFFLR